MTKWIHIDENGDIIITYEWESITIQGEDLEGFHQWGSDVAPEGYHIPSKDEWNKLLQLWAINKWIINEVNLDIIYALEDSELTDMFMKEFNLHFNWWSEDSKWVIDDWDDHWRYWSSTMSDYPNHAYAFRLCGTYAFVNDFDISHGYSIRCFKD